VIDKILRIIVKYHRDAENKTVRDKSTFFAVPLWQNV